MVERLRIARSWTTLRKELTRARAHRFSTSPTTLMTTFPLRFPVLVAVIALLGLATVHSDVGETAQEPAPSSTRPPEPSSDEEENLVLFGAVRPFVDGRLRFEYGDQELREESYSLTWRHRVGLESERWMGFSALAELEHTWSLLDGDQTTRFPGPGRTVIADPENTELNRLQLGFEPGFWDTSITAGRQRITLDDSRFVGNVGWRQNEQTYDAARLQISPLADLTFQYAWLMRVNRIFGEHAPRALLNHLNSDSHLVNARYTGFSLGNLTGFGYLLDFENAAALSSQTYGARFDGSQALSAPLSLTYDLSAAVQTDYGSNPDAYTALHYHSDIGVKSDKGWHVGVGYELLGEDEGSSFQTPLGTNHKFNGYADAFLTTPDGGLRDYYAWIGAQLPGDVVGKLTWHHFQGDDDGDSLGNEIDVTLAHPLGEHVAALGKVAWLDGDGDQVDVLRASLEISYSF